MLIMFAIIATVSAQEPQKVTKPAMKPAMERGYMQANHNDLAPKFTPEQKKQMADFKLAHDKQMIQFNNLLGEKKAQLKTLQQVEKPDMKKVNAKIDEITDLMNQKMKLNAELKNNVRSLLTEEQRLKMDMMMDHRQSPAGQKIRHQGQGQMAIAVHSKQGAKCAGCKEGNKHKNVGKECADCKDGNQHKNVGKECADCKEGGCNESAQKQSQSCCDKDSVKVKVSKVK